MLTSTICAALSAAGLGLAAVTAYRRRFLAATRIAAFALLPVGLYMTGIIGWVESVVLRPEVWAGFALLALSVVLFLVGRVAERRRGPGSRRERRAAARQARGETERPAAPSAAVESRGATAAGSAPERQDAARGEDFSDIEAILKKHGI